MHNGRKGAFLLLVIAVLWSAMPAAACLFESHAMSPLACCRAMAPNCPMHGTDMSSTCCQVQPEQAAAIADVPILPKQVHAPACPLFAPEAVVPILMAVHGWNLPEASPPGISPGAKSILRI